MTRGRGTPDPNRPPTELVAGEAWLFLSPWLLSWAVVALLTFHLRVIAYEEPTLAPTFGQAWEDYRARVPRWLPRLRRGGRAAS